MARLVGFSGGIQHELEELRATVFESGGFAYVDPTRLGFAAKDKPRGPSSKRARSNWKSQLDAEKDVEHVLHALGSRLRQIEGAA